MDSIFLSCTELQGQVEDVVSGVSEKGKACYITEDGRTRAVIVDIDHYNAMLDAIEASEDPDPDHVAARQIIKSHLSGRKIN